MGAFTATLIPLLSQGMHLHSQPLSNEQYREQAKRLQQQIVGVIQQPARHLGVRQIQDIFRDNAHRLYHWVPRGWPLEPSKRNENCVPP